METVENREPSKKEEEEERVNGKNDRKSYSRHRRSYDDDDDIDRRHHHRSKHGRYRDYRDRDRHGDMDRGRESSSWRHPVKTRLLPIPPEKPGLLPIPDRYNRYRDNNRDSEERNGRERNSCSYRDNDGEKDRERSREESEFEMDRSRSCSERHYTDSDKDFKHEEGRDTVTRVRGRRDRDRNSSTCRHYKEKKEEVEPGADPERDQRTVFAYQISLRAVKGDVYDFFSRAGKVRDMHHLHHTRDLKGVGYIEFYDAKSVPMAIALSGQPLLGQPVMVKPSKAEKNLVQYTTAIGSIGPYSGGGRKLYVSNLHFDVTEDQLRQMFEAFGPVELVQLPLDPETGYCKGFCFVQFAHHKDARAAQSSNGQLEIAGRIIRVSVVSDQVGMQEIGVNVGNYNDDDGGLPLNARARANLMQNVDRSGIVSSISGSMASPVLNGPVPPLATTPILGVTPGVNPLVAPDGETTLSPLAGLPGSGLAFPTVPGIDFIGAPSECLLLKNMFDPNAETEPDFDLDIKEDVQEECSKFGVVKHVYVDKDSAGFVYLMFDRTQCAVSAQGVLHGRWFSGKMIEATYMVRQKYETKFPEKIFM